MNVSQKIWLVIAATFACTSVSLAQNVEAEPVRGLVKAQHEALIRSSLVASLEETPVRTGDSFVKGDILIKFSCNVEKAEKAGADAAYRAARTRYDSAQELQETGAAGHFDVALAKAEKEEARARADAQKAMVDHCVIKAPFDGRVSTLFVNAHETPGSDQPLIKIISAGAPEIHLIVPSHWLAKLEIEDQFQFVVDETGAEYRAKIVKIGAEVDAVSKTVPIIAVFDEPTGNISPGMSGEARFSELNG